ncbi:MAG: hypothetical protein AAGC93_28070 [Cyanobacteria bacterium P01_F01_bin.53]
MHFQCIVVEFLWQQQRWAFAASAINGIAYGLVYVLDLAHWFPVSPDAMPPALWVIEVLGTIVSIPLIVLSTHGISAGAELSNATQPKNYPSDVLMVNTTGIVGREKVGIVVVVAIAVVMGMGIVIFATRSAMGV